VGRRSGPHRAETDRNITPTTRQMTGNVQSEQAAARAHGESVAPRIPPVSRSRAGADREAASRPSERVMPPGADTVVISSNREGIGGRWDTFQSRLRARRKEAVAACRTCSGESAVERGCESVENFRKAVGWYASFGGTGHTAGLRIHFLGRIDAIVREIAS